MGRGAPPPFLFLHRNVTIVIFVSYIEGGWMETLGARLKRFRLENGWSKSRVAEKLDVSIPSIMRWEDEIAYPNDYNCFKIERMLIEANPDDSPAGPTTIRLEQLPLFPELGIKPHTIL